MRKYNTIFYYMATANFLFFLGNSMFILFPVFLKNMGASESYIGIMNNIDKIFLIITAVTIGGIFRGRDHLKFLRAGYVILFAAFSSYLLISELSWFIIIIRIMHGIGFSVAMILGTTIIFDIVPIEKAAEAIGVYGVTGAISNAISPFIGEMLISGGCSYYLLFFISAALVFGSLCITLVMPKLNAHAHEPGSIADQAFSRMLSNPRYLLTAVITIIFGGGFGIIITYMPNFIRSTTPFKFSYFFLVYIAVLIIIRFTFMRIVNKVNRDILVMIIFSVGAMMNISLNFLYSMMMLFLAGILYGITHGVLYPLLNATMVGVVEPSDRESANALYTACFNFGMMIFALGLGFLIDYRGSYLAAFNVCAVSCVFAVCLVYFMSRRYGSLGAGFNAGPVIPREQDI